MALGPANLVNAEGPDVSMRMPPGPSDGLGVGWPTVGVALRVQSCPCLASGSGRGAWSAGSSQTAGKEEPTEDGRSCGSRGQVGYSPCGGDWPEGGAGPYLEAFSKVSWIDLTELGALVGEAGSAVDVTGHCANLQVTSYELSYGCFHGMGGCIVTRATLGRSRRTTSSEEGRTPAGGNRPDGTVCLRGASQAADGALLTSRRFGVTPTLLSHKALDRNIVSGGLLTQRPCKLVNGPVLSLVFWQLRDHRPAMC